MVDGRTIANVALELMSMHSHLGAMASDGPVVVGGAATPSTQRPNEELQRRIDRLELIVETMMILLLEKKMIHEDEFRQWRKYVDELDGNADGRVREIRAPQACPACRRNSAPEAQRCQYCGAALNPEILLSKQGRAPAE